MVYTNNTMSSKPLYIYAVLLAPALIFTLAIWYDVNRKVAAEVSSPVSSDNTATAIVASPHPFMVDYLAHENAILIDIRTPEEFAGGHLPGAINIDYYNPLFTQNLRQVASDKTVFIYCRSGNRTSDAYRRLVAQGLEVRELRGGILSYRGELLKE